jgi:hypothetical protein
MAYKISLRVDKISYPVLTDILKWCCTNLERYKDWDFSDETVQLYGTEVVAPTVIWFNEESDVVALKLKLGL